MARRAARLLPVLLLLALVPDTSDARKARKQRARPAPTAAAMRKMQSAVMASCSETMTAPPTACLDACTALVDAGDQASDSPMGVSCLSLLGNALYQSEVMSKNWEGDGTPRQQQFLSYYSRLLERHADQAGPVMQQAQMHVIIGDIYRVQERFVEAYHHFDAASAKLAVDDPEEVSTDATRQGLYRHIRHERLLCLTYEGRYVDALPLYVDTYRHKHGPAWSEDVAEPIDAALVSLEAQKGMQGIDDPTVVSRYKIMHDIEQIEHLGAKGALPADLAEQAAEGLRAAHRMTAGKPDDSLPFKASPSLIESMNSHVLWLNRNLHEPHEELLKRLDVAVNPELDTDQIEKDYHANGVGMTYIDDFVTPEALVKIRTFCEDATIWHETKDGYLAAWMADGFHGELLFQIAEEMRARFPTIFKDHQLGQMWAFKYNSNNTGPASRGVKIHADMAAVNVNFWVTPDDAVIDKESGGLIVYEDEASAGTDFFGYNSEASEGAMKELVSVTRGSAAQRNSSQAVRRSRSTAAARRLVNANRVSCVVCAPQVKDSPQYKVPYKENRLVLFNSSEHHATRHTALQVAYIASDCAALLLC